MEVKFNVSKDGRKALVAAIGEITGWAAVYKGAPSFAFAVSNYIIDRSGTLIYDGRTSIRDVRALIVGLAERGFVFEGEIDGIAPAVSVQDDTGESGDGDAGRPADHNGDDAVNSENEQGGGTGGVTTGAADGKLSINMPLSGFTAPSFDNLMKLVAAKAWIIQKMAGTDALPIERGEKHLRFPWFNQDASPAETDAYSRLIAHLCETAKKKQRVTATMRQLADGDNEKFKARCFLLSLGFIGKEYAQARKILLAPMSGNGSHKSGDHKKSSAPSGTTAADSGGETPEAIHACGDGSSAGSAHTTPRCGECRHHCYYTEGLLRTGAGDIVDTSKRAPDQYTHYCLNTPSGFRRLKHATDWSGCEASPKWCPLSAEPKDGSALEGSETARVCEDSYGARCAHESGSGADSAPTGGEVGYCEEFNRQGVADYE